MHGTNDETTIRDLARRRLADRRAFGAALGSWVAVSALLLAIWFTTTGLSSYFWPIWPILGIGAGVAGTWWRAYGPIRRPISDADVDAEVNRIAGR